jgi:3-oxoacyl-[acyl-carrier protein] reductase
MRLEGHVALVTGGNRNIGRAIALELAARGCAVIVNASRSRQEAEAVAAEARRHGVKAAALLADVGRADDVKALARQALAEFGKVDVLVNNAAIRPEAPFLELSEEDWHRVLAVDLDAAFYTARAFLPAMVAQGWGRIINLTGMNAMQGYVARAHVSAAKHGVTVNAISPGPIESERMTDHQTQHIRGMISRVPLGRLGTPREVASLCGWLASDDGGFVSGQMLGVNGAAST